MALAARHAQAQETILSICQVWIWLGAKAVPNATEGGICLLIFGRARRTADRSGATCMQAIQRGQTSRSHPSA